MIEPCLNHRAQGTEMTAVPRVCCEQALLSSLEHSPSREFRGCECALVTSPSVWTIGSQQKGSSHLGQLNALRETMTWLFFQLSPTTTQYKLLFPWIPPSGEVTLAGVRLPVPWLSQLWLPSPTSVRESEAHTLKSQRTMLPLCFQLPLMQSDK